MTPVRDLRLTSPHLKGPDVKALQAASNRVHARYGLPVIAADGEFGPATLQAESGAEYLLGLPLDQVTNRLASVNAQNVIESGHPATAVDKARARARLRRIMRARRAAAHGPAAAISYAQAFVKVTEDPPGSNRGPDVHKRVRGRDVTGGVTWWQDAQGIGTGNPWCGCFLAGCLRFAGIPQSALAGIEYCPTTVGYARNGTHGWRSVGWSNAQPGDVILYDFGTGTAEHVGLYTGGGTTIEGNTSFGDGGSQANGGAVAQRHRGLPTGVICVARPPYR